MFRWLRARSKVTSNTDMRPSGDWQTGADVLQSKPVGENWDTRQNKPFEQQNYRERDGKQWKAQPQKQDKADEAD